MRLIELRLHEIPDGLHTLIKDNDGKTGSLLNLAEAYPEKSDLREIFENIANYDSCKHS